MVRGNYAGPQVGGGYLAPPPPPEVVQVEVVETVEVPVPAEEESDPVVWIVVIAVVAAVGLGATGWVFSAGKKKGVEEYLLQQSKATDKP
eukprot:COSAG04_NODE_4992_length_1788_cov_2.133807_2_plen_90_part_00